MSQGTAVVVAVVVVTGSGSGRPVVDDNSSATLRWIPGRRLVAATAATWHLPASCPSRSAQSTGARARALARSPILHSQSFSPEVAALCRADVTGQLLKKIQPSDVRDPCLYVTTTDLPGPSLPLGI